MPSQSTGDWLNIWESGLTLRPVEWVLTLLSLAHPDWSIEALAQLSLGQRDADVAALRQSLFGSQVISVATCPACSEQLELPFDVANVFPAQPITPVETSRLALDDWEVDVRLPNSYDLLAIEAAPDLETALSLLRQRCLTVADRDGQSVPANEWPAAVLEAATEHLARLDPLADVQLRMDCPACAHRWHADFDIVRFLWHELNTWAIRTLQEVHQLASAYGWREIDILALSPWRKKVYLELIS